MRARWPSDEGERPLNIFTFKTREVGMSRKGTNGVSTNSHCRCHVFDRGTFGVLPLTYLYLPKSARAYLFPQSVRINYFCSGPISVDPVCPAATKRGWDVRSGRSWDESEVGKRRRWPASVLKAIVLSSDMLGPIFEHSYP